MSAPTVQAVYGMQIQDPRMAIITKRVIQLSVVSAAIVVIRAAADFTVQGDVKALGLGLAFGMCIPACGYFGAKNNNSTLSCLFCGCNLCACICSLFTIGTTAAMVMGLDAIMESNGFTLKECPTGQVGTDFCKGPRSNPQTAPFYQYCGNIHTEKECCACLDNLLDKYRLSMYVAGAFLLPAVCLQCASFYFGNQLYQEQNRGTVIVIPPTGGSVVSMQQVQHVQPTTAA